jgi:NTP pyrophosphatase (non-canonical NTP hydrolase)
MKNLIAAAQLLKITCHEAAYVAGWWKDTETGKDVRDWPHKFFILWVGTKMALIHSEVSEGLEGYRKALMDDKLPQRPALEVELADAVIRIFDLAGGMNYDIGGAIAEKLEYNAKRTDHKLENRSKENGKAF